MSNKYDAFLDEGTNKLMEVLSSADIEEEEKVAIMCAYMLMHFLNTPEGHVFDFLA